MKFFFTMRLFLMAVALALATVLAGCQSLQPTKNADGSQTATPTGKAVVTAADNTVAVVKPIVESQESNPNPLIAGGATLLVAAMAWGLKRLHDKLDDVTPETPVMASVASTVAPKTS